MASVTAELRVPSENVVLEETMRAYPELRLEFERFVPVSDQLMPYLWAVHPDVEAVLETARADPSVERAVLVDDLVGGSLVQISWANLSDCVISGCQNGDEAVLQGVGENDDWFLKIRFGGRDSLGEFQKYCTANDLHFDLLRLYDASVPKLGQFDLTERQRNALVVALEEGYFDVPRRSSLEEIATELGISPNAVSERIRRGEANLFRSALTIPRPPHRDETLP